MQDPFDHEEEIPWISFSDTAFALLFIFIISSFYFMIELKKSKNELDKQTKEQQEKKDEAKRKIKQIENAEKNGDQFLEDIELCFQEKDQNQRYITDVNKKENTLSIFIESQNSQSGSKYIKTIEWFEIGNAVPTSGGVGALKFLRNCMQNHINDLIVKNNYNVLLTLEGHTDAQIIKGALSKRYPSNWELSGARAAAGLRRLLCLDDNCSNQEQQDSQNLLKAMNQSNNLQIIAAGRADTKPAWKALCTNLSKLSFDPVFDQKICDLLNSTNDISFDTTKKNITKVIKKRYQKEDIKGYNRALTTWANAPECFDHFDQICKERFRKLRRVDVRIRVSPNTLE